VGDLGLAKSFAEGPFGGLTATGTRGGDKTYMPPEQFTRFRHVQPAADVWSAGAACYVMLTGQHPRRLPAGQEPDPVRRVLTGAARNWPASPTTSTTTPSWASKSAARRASSPPSSSGWTCRTARSWR